jgi:2',3'-cyclic-nucleotide 2'-phosphodiesterase (5'-nucleotidase family)
MKRIFIILFIISLIILCNAENQKIYIFYTNDLHGGITEQEADFLNPDFPPLLGGGAAAANIIFKYRKIAAENGDIVLLFDAGDIFQGTPLGTKTEGKAIIEYMNDVGYDAVCAGNHDFDLGKDVFINLTRMAEFPVLSANLIDKTSEQVFEHVQPHTIINRGGLKIGVFGITTEATENMSFPQNIEGLDFTAEAPAAQRAVNALHKENADLVIALVHIGLPYDRREGYKELQEIERLDSLKISYLNAMELAHYVNGIDILFGGHIHRGYHEPWEDPTHHTLCFQNYGNGGNLGLVIIEIDHETKTIAGYELPARNSGLLLLTSDEFWPDEKIYADIKSKQMKVEKGYDEILGTSRSALTRSGRGESPINNLICDAMIEATQSDFSVTNFGGIRADLKSGPVTRRDLFKVLPFGNTLVVFQMKGEFLKQLIESKITGNRRGLAIGGGKVEFDPARVDGNKITYFEVGGYPLYPEREYRVVTTDYLAEGNSGMDLLLQVNDANIARTGILLRGSVSEYIQKYSPLEIKLNGRWIRK